MERQRVTPMLLRYLTGVITTEEMIVGIIAQLEQKPAITMMILSLIIEEKPKMLYLGWTSLFLLME